MLYRVLSPVAVYVGGGRPVAPGETVDVSARDARDLVAAGLLRPARRPQVERVESEDKEA